MEHKILNREREIEDIGRSHAAEAWDQRNAYEDAYTSYGLNLNDTAQEQGWSESELDLASAAFEKEWQRCEKGERQ